MNRSRSAEINPQPNILREDGNRRKKKQTLGKKKGECHGVVGATAVGPACVSASSGGTVKRGGWRGFPLLFFSSLPQAIIVSKRMGRKRRRQKKKRKPCLPPPFPCISPLNDSILRGGGSEGETPNFASPSSSPSYTPQEIFDVVLY